MTITVSTSELTEFRAGDRLRWTRTLSDYDAASWTLAYTLTNASTSIPISASGTGTLYTVDVAPATTAAYGPGSYQMVATLTQGTADRVTLGPWQVKVLPDLAAATAGYEWRSEARIALAAIEAVLAGRATKDQEEYAIEGRSLKHTPIADLVSMRDFWRRRVAEEDRAERIKQGLGGANNIFVRFV